MVQHVLRGCFQTCCNWVDPRSVPRQAGADDRPGTPPAAGADVPLTPMSRSRPCPAHRAWAAAARSAWSRARRAASASSTPSIPTGEVSGPPSALSQDPEPGCGITLSSKTQVCYRLRSLGEIIWEIPVDGRPNVTTDHIINLARPPDVRSAARDQDIILREDANGGPKEVSTHE